MFGVNGYIGYFAPPNQESRVNLEVDILTETA